MVPAYGFMFDNIGGMATGIAIVNADSISGQFLLNFYASGALVASKVLNLGPLQHMTVASAQYPELANLRGYAELKRIDVPGGKNFYPYLSATVLRFDPSGSIAAMPMMGIY